MINSYKQLNMIISSYLERLRDRPNEVSAADYDNNTVPIPANVFAFER